MVWTRIRALLLVVVSHVNWRLIIRAQGQRESPAADMLYGARACSVQLRAPRHIKNIDNLRDLLGHRWRLQNLLFGIGIEGQACHDEKDQINRAGEQAQTRPHFGSVDTLEIEQIEETLLHRFSRRHEVLARRIGWPEEFNRSAQVGSIIMKVKHANPSHALNDNVHAVVGEPGSLDNTSKAGNRIGPWRTRLLLPPLPQECDREITITRDAVLDHLLI